MTLKSKQPAAKRQARSTAKAGKASVPKAKEHTPRARAARATAVIPDGRRTRMNLMVDRGLLARAAKAAGTDNLSDVVDRALRGMTENDAIVAGIDAAFGSIPAFPPDDRP